MNYAIILSGGTGTRLGAKIPKQYLIAKDRPVISYCLETFANHHDIDAIIIVAAPEWQNLICKEIKKISHIPFSFATPGDTRQLSIYNGLRTINSLNKDDLVIIHDAARPLVSPELISSCLDSIQGEYDGSLPVIPVKDTIYQSLDKNRITGLLDRSTLYAGQAPEAFRLGKYKQAHMEMAWDDLFKINGSSELAYKMGLKIKLLTGDPRNYKITDSSDLERFIDTLQ